MQDSIYDRFVGMYRDRVSRTIVGSYAVEGAELGPLINKC